MRLVAKCLAMGGDWYMYDEMTERLRFLHLETSWEEDFSEAWRMYSIDHDTSDTIKVNVDTKIGNGPEGAAGDGADNKDGDEKVRTPSVGNR